MTHPFARVPLVDFLLALALMMVWVLLMLPRLGWVYGLWAFIGALLLVGLLWWQWPNPWGSAARIQHWGKRAVLRLNAANQLTLVRALMVIMVLAAIAVPELSETEVWLLLSLSVLALMLDGVDGWLARRQHLQSAYGARFDMEVDAAFIMGLCLLLLVLERAGLWVLLIGALRYLFWGAGFIGSWLQRPLPPSQRRRWICGWQVVSLLVALPGVLSLGLTHWVLGSALVLLVYSFARDTLWLFQEREHV